MREWEKMCAEWATRKKTKNNLFSASFLFWCFEWEPFRLLPALLFQKRTFFFSVSLALADHKSIRGFVCRYWGGVCHLLDDLLKSSPREPVGRGSLRMVIVHEFWVACRTAERRQKNVFCWWFFFPVAVALTLKWVRALECVFSSFTPASQLNNWTSDQTLH